MTVLKKIDEHLEEWFLAATLIVMVILTFTQIVMRFVFSASLSWSEELVRYIFLWQVWVGVSYATKKSKHLRIEILPGKLPAEKRWILTVAVNIIWLGFSLFMVYQSWDVVMRVKRTAQVSPALQLPMWIPYLSVVVGFALMSVRLIQDIRGVLRGGSSAKGEAQ